MPKVGRVHATVPRPELHAGAIVNATRAGWGRGVPWQGKVCNKRRT